MTGAAPPSGLLGGAAADEPAKRISVDVHDGVADVRLSRPEKMNALDAAMFEALVATGERLRAQRGLRAVVLSGEGRAFCAGLDSGRFQAMAGSDDPMSSRETNRTRLGRRTHGPANAAQQAVLVWRLLPVPVIAAVHGVAFGGGFQLALGADLRFVAPDARLSIMEIRWGLVPDMGGIALARALARSDVVRELTWSGRQFSGREALELGFATRVCDDPRADALAFARDIAGRSPDAIRGAKRLLNLAESHALAEILQAESDEQIALLGSANQREAVLANLEKRAPRFTDPD
ncbi:MAG: crotonase/enoyl-CoA hydratase family protein [Lautropia sp.]